MKRKRKKLKKLAEVGNSFFDDFIKSFLVVLLGKGEKKIERVRERGRKIEKMEIEREEKRERSKEREGKRQR